MFWPELGEFFVSLRTAKGWGQRQAAEIANRRGLKVLTRQVMLRLETGQTKNPEPDVLRALSTLYGMPFPQVLAAFITHRYGVPVSEGDLKRSERAVGPMAAPKPDPEITERRARAKAIAERMEKAANEILRAAADLQVEASSAGGLSAPRVRKRSSRSS